MKICAIICEYNPFHNGHAYLLSEAKRQTGADFLVCVMSGNFVQRGEAAILNKYERARNAVLSGADAVVELPVVFSTSNAELFAKGGVKIARALGADFLSFGVESGKEDDFLQAAKTLIHEPKEISDKIKEYLNDGESYAKAREKAWGNRFPNGFLLTPNNILGVEYAKAIVENGYPVKLFPIPRIGVEHNANDPQGHFASAKTIREAVGRGEKDTVKPYLPPYVFQTLENDPQTALKFAERLALITRSKEEIKRVLDCTEGLENAVKKQATDFTQDVCAALTSKRYTASRIKRILLQNLLKIDERFIRACLQAPLYLRLLSILKEKEELLSVLSKNETTICRAGDQNSLSGIAKECFEKDVYADDVYAVITEQSPPKKNIFI